MSNNSRQLRSMSSRLPPQVSPVGRTVADASLRGGGADASGGFDPSQLLGLIPGVLGALTSII